MGVRQSATILFPDSVESQSEKAGKLAMGGKLVAQTSAHNTNIDTLTCQIIVLQILFFLGEKNTYTTLLGPTRLLISDNFPSKPDFHLHK